MRTTTTTAAADDDDDDDDDVRFGILVGMADVIIVVACDHRNVGMDDDGRIHRRATAVMGCLCL